jgi:isopenicillin N synthase-like dioxygenase
MKLVSYPPISVDVSATTQTGILQGVGAHCDSNFLTLICQDAHSSGLQVQNVQGGWVDVPPTEPNTLICNIGELAEVWTGGYFLATPHRVMLRPSATSSRTSLPVFYNPKLDTVLEPIDTSALPWERSVKKQWRRKHNKLMASVGENSFKSLARSHPAVFGKHHNDLQILEDGSIVKR